MRKKCWIDESDGDATTAYCSDMCLFPSVSPDYPRNEQRRSFQLLCISLQHCSSSSSKPTADALVMLYNFIYYSMFHHSRTLRNHSRRWKERGAQVARVGWGFHHRSCNNKEIPAVTTNCAITPDSLNKKKNPSGCITFWDVAWE